jgi:3-phenylpropionate/trans-cinnamate dioxygenase ferredoxin reductase subunit
VVLRGDVRSDSVVLFYLDGDKLRSAMGPNAARDLRFARRLIESRKSVDRQLLADTGVAMSKV